MKKLFLTFAIILTAMLGYNLYDQSPEGGSEREWKRTAKKSQAQGAVLSEEEVTVDILSDLREERDQTLWPEKLTAVLDPKLSHRQRMQAALKLGNSLTSDEIEILCRFLADKQSGDEIYELKNTVLNRIRAQKSLDQKNVDQLVAIAQDKGFDPVLRAYLYQHLSVVPETVPGFKVRAEQLLWEAVDELDDTVSGSALMSLSHWKDEQVQQKLEERLPELLNALDNENFLKASALSIAVEKQLPSALEHARSILDTKDKVIPLKLVALNAIAAMGGADDISLCRKTTRIRSLRKVAYDTISKLQK